MDTIEIKLPSSGITVTIRNYTTRADDEKSEQALYAGVEMHQKTGHSEGEANLTFPIANVMASQACYIPRLVTSIDGDPTNIKNRLDELRSEDYEAISTAVTDIVEQHSPKVTEASKASKKATNES